jgi:hypothetical protein
VAAQHQRVSTDYFKNKVLQDEIDSGCRLYKQHETIDRLTSGCPILAKNEYLTRDDRVGAYLHYPICKAVGIETTEKLILSSFGMLRSVGWFSTDVSGLLIGPIFK